jgi:hypothetical protein
LSLALANGSRIISLPGNEETVRGFSGVALAIIDEAARVPDDLYLAVRPMLAVSGGRLVCLSTPYGKRGWFFEAWERGAEWQKVKVAADQCPRISKEFLAQEERAMGRRYFRQEYHCSFESLVDAYFDSESIQAALVDAEATLDLDWTFGGEDSAGGPAPPASPSVDEDPGPSLHLDWTLGEQ